MNDADNAAMEAALKAAKRERKRKRISAAMKKAWADPEVRAMRSAAMKKAKIPPELKPIYTKLYRVLGRDAARAELARMMEEPS